MAIHAPNGPEGFAQTFKDLGTMIGVYDEIVAGNKNLKNKLVASIEQQDYDYGTVKSLSTYINNMVSASTNLDTAQTNLQTAVSNYATTVLAIDLNTTSTTASGVLADLAQAMYGRVSVGASAPSGLYILSGGQFDNFFREEYGIIFPVASGAVHLTVAESMDMISGTMTSTRRLVPDTWAD